MLQGNVARHWGAKGKWDAEGTKLACRRAMCLGTGVLKAKGCRRRHKACMLEGNVTRHGGAEGEGMPKAIESLRVARQCG
ncbi:unnamed protein product [Prunus armeniaca]